MADTIVGAHNGSFKDSGAIGMSEIRDFLVNRDGVSAENYAADNLPGSISLQKLYNVSQQNEIELSAAYPSSNYNLGGFYGSNYTNNTPPVISLLGPNYLFGEVNNYTAEPYSYHACDPSVDLSGYVYDDRHYIVRFVKFIPSTFIGAAIVYELYCYGSNESFVSDFGDNTIPGSNGFSWIPSGGELLFREDIGVGYIKVYIQMHYPVSYLAANEVFETMQSNIKNHTLDDQWALHQENYRNYIHPEPCVGTEKFDPHYKNAVLDRHRLDDVDTLVDNGAMDMHKSAINGISLSNGEQVTVYAIKKL